MNQIILGEYRKREQNGQLRLIPSESGRTLAYQEIRAGKIVAEGGVCNDPECDCHGEWQYWKES